MFSEIISPEVVF